MNDEEILLDKEPARFTPDDMNRLLIHCFNVGASDITLQSQETVYAEIYGQLKPVTRHKLSTAEVGDMINYIYGPNGTTQISSGKDVDTHYDIRPNRHDLFRFRVNGTACLVEGHDGIQITLRTIPTDPPLLDDLGLEPDLLKSISPQQGIVFVTGATGSGKSTLLASIIRKLVEQADGNRKILTYESPIEFVYDNVDKPSSIVAQSEIPRHLPSFAAGVRNALRRKPMAILVGESRDSETISATIDAALTGHPVYTTLHSNGVAETVRRLVSSFPQEERTARIIDIIETIRVVIWQKLVPTVDNKRVALREYLVFDDNIRDQILSSDLDSITATTRELVKKYGQPMHMDAKKKFEAGIIDERTYNILKVGAKLAENE